MPIEFQLCFYSYYALHQFHDVGQRPAINVEFKPVVAVSRGEGEFMTSWIILVFFNTIWLVFCIWDKSVYLWSTFETCTHFWSTSVVVTPPKSRIGLLFCVYMLLSLYSLIILLNYFFMLHFYPCTYYLLFQATPVICCFRLQVAILFMSYSRCNHDTRNRIVTFPYLFVSPITLSFLVPTLIPALKVFIINIKCI